MQKIKQLSSWLERLCLMLLILLPILLVVFWAMANPTEGTSGTMIKMGNDSANLVTTMGIKHMPALGDPILGLHPAPTDLPIMHQLKVGQRLLATLISLLSFSFSLYIIFCLKQLFKRYRAADVFSLQHIKYFKRIAYTLIIGQFCTPLLDGLLGLILTWHNPPGYRLLNIGFDNTNVTAIFTGIIVLIIAWIMGEAYQLKQELQLTV